jgi:hypothetical protein
MIMVVAIMTGSLAPFIHFLAVGNAWKRSLYLLTWQDVSSTIRTSQSEKMASKQRLRPDMTCLGLGREGHIPESILLGSALPIITRSLANYFLYRQNSFP